MYFFFYGTQVNYKEYKTFNHNNKNIFNLKNINVVRVKKKTQVCYLHGETYSTCFTPYEYLFLSQTNYYQVIHYPEIQGKKTLWLKYPVERGTQLRTTYITKALILKDCKSTMTGDFTARPLQSHEVDLVIFSVQGTETFLLSPETDVAFSSEVDSHTFYIFFKSRFLHFLQKQILTFSSKVYFPSYSSGVPIRALENSDHIFSVLVTPWVVFFP